MSEDWNIYCKDCGETHKFRDANHQVELMHGLIEHADAIAALAPLMNDWGSYITLSAEHYGSIEPKWFLKHRGHELVPISEYGNIDGQCDVYVKCTCGYSKRCTLEKGHDGVHTIASV